jgi:hypothetical protein
VKQASALKKAATPAEFALPITLRPLDQVHERIRAHIRRVNTGFFLIASPVAFRPEQRVEVTFEERRIETQVMYCHAQPEGGFQAGLSMTQDGSRPLRTEPRIPMDMPAELTLPGMDTPSAARLVNISASGLGLNVDQHIPPGEMAFVKLENGFAFGEIRHCSKVPTGYRVGMKLDEFIELPDQRPAAGRRSTQREKPTGWARFFGTKT